MASSRDNNIEYCTGIPDVAQWRPNSRVCASYLVISAIQNAIVALTNLNSCEGSYDMFSWHCQTISRALFLSQHSKTCGEVLQENGGECLLDRESNSSEEETGAQLAANYRLPVERQEKGENTDVGFIHILTSKNRTPQRDVQSSKGAWSV